MKNVETFRFSTQKFDGVDKFHAWQNQNTMGDLKLCHTDIGAPTDLDVSFRGTHVGNVMLGALGYTTKIANDRITYETVRTPRRIKCDGLDYYFFRTSREHAWQSTSDASVTSVGARQIFFADLAQPFRVDIPSGDVVILMIPRDFVPLDLSARHGSVFSGLMASPASQYILGLAENIDNISQSDSQIIGEVTLNMLLAAAFPSSNNIESIRSSLEIELIKKIKVYINTHLESSKLCINSICQNIGLSRATLYRLFSTENHSVAEYIRLLRLRRIHYILRGSTESRIRISELANRYGFCYNSSFSKLFKYHFGCAPSDIRRNTPVEPRSENCAAAPSDLMFDFKEWHNFPTQVVNERPSPER